MLLPAFLQHRPPRAAANRAGIIQPPAFAGKFCRRQSGGSDLEELHIAASVTKIWLNSLCEEHEPPSRALLGKRQSILQLDASLTCRALTICHLFACSSGGLELRSGGQLHLRAAVCQVSVRPSVKTPPGSAVGPPLMLAEYLLHWLLRPAAGMLCRCPAQGQTHASSDLKPGGVCRQAAPAVGGWHLHRRGFWEERHATAWSRAPAQIPRRRLSISASRVHHMIPVRYHMFTGRHLPTTTWAAHRQLDLPTTAVPCTVGSPSPLRRLRMDRWRHVVAVHVV